MLFFREFRPIDSQQSSSHLFHPSTEETPLGGGVSACGLWLVCFCLLLGCLCPFLHHLTVFPFFQGTMPTGVRTRGKNTKGRSEGGCFLQCSCGQSVLRGTVDCFGRFLKMFKECFRSLAVQSRLWPLPSGSSRSMLRRWHGGWIF